MFPIVRMYDSDARARDAAQALSATGLFDDAIIMISPGPDAQAQLDQANADGRIPRGQAGPLARGLANGRTVVSASGPLQFGAAIERALESAGPVDTHVLSGVGGSSADPFSQALGIRTLSRRQKPMFGALTRSDFAPTSFFPLLTSGKAIFGGLTSSNFALTSFMPLLTSGKPMFGGLTSSDFSFSKMLGMPLLSKNGTPLSSFLGWRTLSDDD